MRNSAKLFGLPPWLLVRFTINDNAVTLATLKLANQTRRHVSVKSVPKLISLFAQRWRYFSTRFERLLLLRPNFYFLLVSCHYSEQFSHPYTSKSSSWEKVQIRATARSIWFERSLTAYDAFPSLSTLLQTILWRIFLNNSAGRIGIRARVAVFRVTFAISNTLTTITPKVY